MENLLCHFQSLSHDLLTDITARLDGSALATAACSCSDLRDVARDQSLWKHLCNSTWPSTTLKEAEHLILSSPGSFDKFYAGSYPLILYNQSSNDGPPAFTKIPEVESNVSPWDFASLVDVYYKDKCVFSRVVDGIPDAYDVYDENDIEAKQDATTPTDKQKWFADCPFTLELLSCDNHEGTNSDDEVGDPINGYAGNDHNHDANHENIGCLPSISMVEDGENWGNFGKKLEDIRLSWVLLHKNTGKAVNLSSPKPLSIKRSWQSDRDYVLRFGSTVSLDESMLPHKFAEFVILARCKLTEGRCVKWREIGMSIEDMTGARVNGGKSLMVLRRALYSLRSNNHDAVEKGYRQYAKLKSDMRKTKMLKHTLADTLCLSIEIVVLATLCYICTK